MVPLGIRPGTVVEVGETFQMRVARGIGDMITVTFHARGKLGSESTQWVGRLTTFGARTLPQFTLP